MRNKLFFSLSLLLVLLATWIAPASTPAETKVDLPVPFALDQTNVFMTVPPYAPAPTFKKMDWPKPDVIKGVYATGWMAGSAKWFPQIIKFIDETEVNALVIDVKDDAGTLSYVSEVPLVKEIGAVERKISDPHQMIAILKSHQIYPIARIVVFKDPFLAKSRPEWAVRDTNGSLWRDNQGLNWVDPYNKLLWDYILDIAKEAINIGFQEIQFDYVRFTSDGQIKRCVYPFNTGEPPEDVIQSFLQYARTKLKPYQVPISADIFGLTTSATDDLGIGQQYEKIIASVDVVSPMVYPSHYALGTFGFKNPNLNPYGTVYNGLKDAKKRLDKSGNSTTIIRPWLQDFNLGAPYGRNEIQAQIKAVKDAGLKEWIFWNPSCRYLNSKYN